MKRKQQDNGAWRQCFDCKRFISLVEINNGSAIYSAEKLKWKHGHCPERRNPSSALQKMRAREANTKHGDYRTRLYRIWCGMRSRCLNPNEPCYHNYGGRGISICQEWDDFLNFKSWAIGNGYTEVLTLDRTDNSRGYSPDNCRWVSRAIQCKNMRVNHWVTAFGETKHLADWVRDPRCKISHTTLCDRINHKGWDVEEAIATPSWRTAKWQRKSKCGNEIYAMSGPD